MAFDFVADQYDLDLDYSYNPASQLVHQRLSHHQYQHTDAIGRQGEYQSDGLNQYTNIDGVAVKYDNNGNLTKLADQSFQYDSENRLTSAVVGNTAALDYDPKGRLHRLTIDGDATTFLYDGDSLVAEYHGNTLAKRYVHSTTFDTPLAGYTGSNISNASREYYHRNHQGSIIAISDQNGSVDTINTYDAYGNPGAGNEGRFGYTGQVALHELGLYHYRARVYSPGLGRFLQTDPIGYADQMNLYAYVHNDPMNYTDPSGMCAQKDKNCVEQISRTTNADNSVTVTRTDVVTNGNTVTTTPSGTLKLLPQATANGAPATVTASMEGKLLDVSETVSDTVNVHSGVRTQAQQNALQGNTANTVASTSQHTVGDAADISVSSMTGADLAKTAVDSGAFERVNLYSSGAVHVDQKNVGQGTQYYEDWRRKPNP